MFLELGVGMFFISQTRHGLKRPSVCSFFPFFSFLHILLSSSTWPPLLSYFVRVGTHSPRGPGAHIPWLCLSSQRHPRLNPCQPSAELGQLCRFSSSGENDGESSAHRKHPACSADAARWLKWTGNPCFSAWRLEIRQWCQMFIRTQHLDGEVELEST